MIANSTATSIGQSCTPYLTYDYSDVTEVNRLQYILWYHRPVKSSCKDVKTDTGMARRSRKELGLRCCIGVDAELPLVERISPPQTPSFLTKRPVTGNVSQRGQLHGCYKAQGVIIYKSEPRLCAGISQSSALPDPVLCAPLARCSSPMGRAGGILRLMQLDVGSRESHQAHIILLNRRTTISPPPLPSLLARWLL